MNVYVGLTYWEPLSLNFNMGFNVKRFIVGSCYNLSGPSNSYFTQYQISIRYCYYRQRLRPQRLLPIFSPAAWMSCNFLGFFSLWRMVEPSNLPRTYEMLHCNVEPYRFECQQDPSVQKATLLFYFKNLSRQIPIFQILQVIFIWYLIYIINLFVYYLQVIVLTWIFLQSRAAQESKG